MFTGIIEEVGTVNSVRRKKEGLSITVGSASVAASLTPGESVSVNGACLTVTETIRGRSFSAEVVPETVERTNLVRLRTGDRVNLERSLKLGDRLSGHIVLGHVDGVGEVTGLSGTRPGKTLRVRPGQDLMPYLALKGSVAVDGVSLTVSGISPAEFEISLISYTLGATIAGGYRVGTKVNIEVDVVARYLEGLLKRQSESGEKGVRRGLTSDFLKEKW
jgi:riboflavin synthase